MFGFYKFMNFEITINNNNQGGAIEAIAPSARVRARRGLEDKKFLK